MKTNMIRFGILLLALCATGAQAAILYAISGDDFGIPRRVNQIDTSAATVTPVFDLGDGSLGFFGLTFVNNQFYTVANTGFGNGTLHSFSLTDGGTTTPLFGLGPGFVGGLVAQSDTQLYALSNDFTGASSLHAIDLTGASVSLVDTGLGFGLAGGLTWDPDSSLLYALGSDFSFVQTLYSIDPTAPGSSTAATDPLGMGIIGGVDHAGVDGIFAIGNQPFGGPSELLSLTLGSGGTPLLPLAPFPSYTFSALTSGPAFDVPPGDPVSAPPVVWLLLAALWPLLRRLPKAG